MMLSCEDCGIGDDITNMIFVTTGPEKTRIVCRECASKYANDKINVKRISDALGGKDGRFGMKGLRRFFAIKDAHGDDVLINVFRIDHVRGREVTMASGAVFALTTEEADELTALIQYRRQNGTNN